MDKKKVSPKDPPQKASEGGADRAYVVQSCPDPVYIGLQLRGLARLVFCAAGSRGIADPFDAEAGFFVSSTLEQMAAALGAR